MVLSFLPLERFEESICLPDPTIFPDPLERKEKFLANRNNLRSITDFLVSYIVLNIFLTFPFSAHIFWTTLCAFHLLLLVLFCRTRVWMWHWTYTFGLSIIQFLLTKFIRDSFVFALGATFITPIFVLQMTNEINYLVINFLMQAVLLHLQYKPGLQQLLLYSNAQDFTENFINTASLVLIATTVTYGLRSKVLQDIHDSLKVSRTEVIKAHSQLTVFLQTFAHELRNPLNSLMGNLELALHENLSPSIHEMIETAKVCADILLQLINNILDTSTVQFRKLDINPASTRVIDFVAGIWRISRNLIKRKKLNGYLKIDRRLPPILHLDFYRVNQILLNLISNALKFTTKGQIWIKFSWLAHMKLSERCFMPYPYDEDGVFEKEHNMRAIYRSTAEADHIIYLESNLDMLKDLYTNFPLHEESGILKIIVRDTGCGIRKENLHMLFKKFSQICEDSLQREIGAGLGLYITKEICESMGGEIRVYTKLGIGTTFIVCIPTYCPVQTGPTISLSEVMEKLKKVGLQAMIMDDNIFNQDLLSNYISKIEGKVLHHSRNGPDGYEKYKEFRLTKTKINVVFVDIDVSVLNGILMTRQIREYEANAHLNPVKIIFLGSSYEQVQVNDLLNRNGKYRGQNFLKKPVSFEAFLNTLGNMNLSSVP